jgi:hypothetical protein
MKFKWRLWSGPTFAAVVLTLVFTWCVLAYIFMWPPVVTYTYGSSACPCINNLIQLDAGINQWTIEHNKHNGDAVTLNDLKPYIKLKANGDIPSCPSGGIYSVSFVGQPPISSLGTATQIPNYRVRVGYFHWTWTGWNENYFHRLPN